MCERVGRNTELWDVLTPIIENTHRITAKKIIHIESLWWKMRKKIEISTVLVHTGSELKKLLARGPVVTVFSSCVRQVTLIVILSTQWNRRVT